VGTKKLKFICVIIFVLLMAVAANAQSHKPSHPLPDGSKNPITSAAVASNQDQTAENAAASELLAKYTFILAAATGVMAIATICLGGISLWQAHISSDTAHRQLRAYMGVKVENEILIDASDDHIDFRLVFHNFGETPAYRVHFHGDVRLLDDPLEPNVFNIDMDKSPEYAPRVIQPGDNFRYVARLNITKEQRECIKAGNEQRIYIWGVLRYWDAFKEMRYNKFRFYFGGEECARAKSMFWAAEKNANQAN
jgi:hypothetical protein